MPNVNTKLRKIKTFDAWKARKWREAAEISQHTLSQRMGLGPHGHEYICRAENWTLRVTHLRCETWARAVGCVPFDLESAFEDLLLSRVEFERWVRAGRPNVRDFVLATQTLGAST